MPGVISLIREKADRPVQGPEACRPGSEETFQEIASALSFVIEHYPVTVAVQEAVGGTVTPLSGISAYVFRSDGAYQGLTAATDAGGIVSWSLPGVPPEGTLAGYRVRADYLGYRFWSADFDPKTSDEVEIPVPSADVSAAVVGEMQEDRRSLSAGHAVGSVLVFQHFLSLKTICEMWPG